MEQGVVKSRPEAMELCSSPEDWRIVMRYEVFLAAIPQVLRNNAVSSEKNVHCSPHAPTTFFSLKNSLDFPST